MSISELISELEKQREEFGEMPVYFDTQNGPIMHCSLVEEVRHSNSAGLQNDFVVLYHTKPK